MRQETPSRERREEAALARLFASNPDLAQAAELVALGKHAEAETLLRHALALRSDDVLARFDLAAALFAAQQAEAALAELAPDNSAYRNLKAGCLGLIGDDAGAEALHAGLAVQFPGNSRIAINNGHALRTAGKREAAIAAYRRAVSLRPQAGEGWWGLANLKVGALTPDDGATMRPALAGPLPDEDRMHLAYALGRCAEDAGDAAEAFAHYGAGAALAKQRPGSKAEDYVAQAEAVAATYTPEFIAARRLGC